VRWRSLLIEQLSAMSRQRHATLRPTVGTGCSTTRPAGPHWIARATADRASAAEDRRLAALDRQVSAIELRSAYRDDLTGALLRDAGRDQLLLAFDRAQRAPSPLVLAFLDVDNLKSVNDSQGHAAGDAVLVAVGGALRAQLRSYDIVVRWGGDEFVCALSECPEAEARLRFSQVAEHVAGLTSVSVGIVVVDAGEALDHAVSRADSAMYETRTPTGSLRLPAAP